MEAGDWSWRLIVANDDVVVIRCAGGRRLVFIWMEAGGWSWRLIVANDDVVVIR